MIVSFKNEETRRLFRTGISRRYGLFARLAARRLNDLDRAGSLNDLRVPPGNRLERLKGDRAGQWSIRVNDQFRICFTWDGDDAGEVEMVDYH